MLDSIVILCDANVLYPATLRSLLMYLGTSGLVELRWTHQIHEEWIESLLRDWPDLSRQALEETRYLMNRHVEHALVEGYQYLIPSLLRSDPND